MTTSPPPTFRNAKVPPPVLDAEGNTQPAAPWLVLVVAILVFGGLAITAAVLFGVGAHKNAQISALKSHGVTMQTSVTTCTGLLGGSGSNAAGYTCSVAFSLGGHRYVDILPGTNFYRPHTSLRAVVDRQDPRLITTPGILSSEHSSASVYLLPAILLAVAIIGAVLLVIRRRTSAKDDEPG